MDRNGKRPLRASVAQYHTRAAAGRRIYTDQDEIKAYGCQGIPDPGQVSCQKLFINGIQQPPSSYLVAKGALLIKTDDLPLPGAPLVLFSLTFWESAPRYLQRARVSGLLPRGPAGSRDRGKHRPLVRLSDAVLPSLTLETSLLSGPETLPAGGQATWTYGVTLTNQDKLPLEDLILQETPLPDQVTDFAALAFSRGTLHREGGYLIWKIGGLEPGASVNLSFCITGSFFAAGQRALSQARLRGKGQEASEAFYFPLSAGPTLRVTPGLTVYSLITAGPVQLSLHKVGSWQLELHVVNQSPGPLLETRVFYRLPESLSLAADPEILSHSQGSVFPSANRLQWQPGTLEKGGRALLVVGLSGSFSSTGAHGLGQVWGEALDKGDGPGRPSSLPVTTRPSADLALRVLAPSRAASCQSLPLILENRLFSSQAVLSGEKRSWRFSLSVTNRSEKPLRDLWVQNTLLLDEVESIQALDRPGGNLTLSDQGLAWHLPLLLPGQTLGSSFQVTGRFVSTGLRCLGRALASAVLAKGSPLACLTAPQSGPWIQVLDFQRHYQAGCMMANKVYDQCSRRDVTPEVFFPFENQDLQQLRFLPGRILPHTLRLCPLPGRPGHQQVDFTLSIPFQVMTKEGQVLQGQLPPLPQTAFLWMPDIRDEIKLQVLVETAAQVAGRPQASAGCLIFRALVYSRIASVGRVQLFLPLLPAGPPPQICEPFPPRLGKTVPNFPEFHDFYPQQEPPSPQVSPVQPGSAGLQLETTLLFGPLGVTPGQSVTWHWQYCLRYRGQGPVHQVLMRDRLLLEQVEQVQVLSVSQGTVKVENASLCWQVGLLYDGAVALLTVALTGSLKNRLEAAYLQHHALSDGVSRDYFQDQSSIPDPGQVSCYDLFINGVIQPKTNYQVEKGGLILKTPDLPLKGTPLVLESLIVREQGAACPLTGDETLFLAYGKGHSYRETDQIPAYGPGRIPAPQQVSYQQLFVNGVLQPPSTYTVEPGHLLLKTEDLPLNQAPVALQSVSLFQPEPGENE